MQEQRRSYVLQATDDSRFSFSCDDFDVRLSRSCRGDYLQITDFSTVNYK